MMGRRQVVARICIDESLPHAIAGAFMSVRSQDVIAVHHLKLAGTADPQLLERLKAHPSIKVLVTSDAAMLNEHAAHLVRWGGAVVVLPKKDAGRPLYGPDYLVLVIGAYHRLVALAERGEAGCWSLRPRSGLRQRKDLTA